MTTEDYGTLYDLKTGEKIGPATVQQAAWSTKFANRDNGAFVINAAGEPVHYLLSGRVVFIQEALCGDGLSDESGYFTCIRTPGHDSPHRFIREW